MMRRKEDEEKGKKRNDEYKEPAMPARPTEKKGNDEEKKNKGEKRKDAQMKMSARQWCWQ